MWTCIANCPFLIWPKRTAEVQRVGGLLQKTTAQDSVKDNPDAAITARTVYTLGPPKTKPTLAWANSSNTSLHAQMFKKPNHIWVLPVWSNFVYNFASTILMVFVGFSSGFLLLRTKGVFVNQRDKLDHPHQWEPWYFVEVGAGAMATNFAAFYIQ